MPETIGYSEPTEQIVDCKGLGPQANITVLKNGTVHLSLFQGYLALASVFDATGARELADALNQAADAATMAELKFVEDIKSLKDVPEDFDGTVNDGVGDDLQHSIPFYGAEA